MIFTGDFVYPFDEFAENLPKISCSQDFLVKTKVVNFESSLQGVCQTTSNAPIPLLSTKHSLNVLRSLNFRVACLANNHVKDFETNFDELNNVFNASDMKTVGAGKDINNAGKELQIDDYIILNFGWSVIGCPKAGKNVSGCNPFIYEKVRRDFIECKLKYPNKKIVIVFHWGYEFELYPHPAHRELARELAEGGAYAIIGHHSHLIMGAETVNGAPIFYGLGNFYMPQHRTIRGSVLKYPDVANTGLCVDISDRDNIRYYLAIKDDSNNLNIIHEEYKKIDKSLNINCFKNMSNKQYIQFFKENRIKTKGLPIYKKTSDNVQIRDLWVLLRQLLIDSLVKFNLK